MNAVENQFSLNRGASKKQIPINNLNSLKCYPVFVPPVNLALNQPRSASSSYVNFGPEKAVDGSTTTRWAALTETTPWLEVDLGNPTTVTRTKFREYCDRIASYKTQYFDGTWKDAFTGGNPANPEEEASFPAVTGTKFRLQVLTSSSEPSIWEFELYNDPYLTPSAPAAKLALGTNCVVVTWPGVPGSTYTVQRTTNLVTSPFVTIESCLPVWEATNSATMIRPDPAAYYRVLLE